ncbi:hypothetical protein [Maricaulis salignorans]|uniref:hypothetical protein n=1 Tax=Maricaulis salignorans TaxID=144026 RepID=UPI003A8FB7A7
MRTSNLAFIAAIAGAIATMIFPILFGSPPDAGAAPMADGFVTPVLALEFARSAQDLAFLQGEGAASMRAFLVHTQSLDLFFPLAYAGMAAMVFLALGLRNPGRWLAWAALAVAVVTIGADWAENTVMNRLLAELGTGAEPRPGLLAALYGHTWIKWGLIGLYAALFAVLMWQDKRRLLAIPAVVAALAIAATWLSGSNGQLAEIMAALLIPFMLTFPLAALMYLRGKSAPPEAGAT